MSSNLPTIYQDEIDYIERRHESFNLKLATALEDAIQAGAALIDLKAKCKHGEFTKLVTERTSLSMKTAQRYMNAHSNRLELLERGVDPEVIQQMSLTALVDLNRKPKSEPEPELGERFHQLAEDFKKARQEFVDNCIEWNQKLIRLASEATWQQMDEYEVHYKYLMAKGEMSVFDVRFVAHLCIRHLMRNPERYSEQDAATDPNWAAKVAFDARVAHLNFLYWFINLDAEGLLRKGETTEDGDLITSNMTPAEIMDYARVELINGEMLANFDPDEYVSEDHTSDLKHFLSSEAMDAVNAIYDRGLLAA